MLHASFITFAQPNSVNAGGVLIDWQMQLNQDVSFPQSKDAFRKDDCVITKSHLKTHLSCLQDFRMELFT